MTEIEMTMPFNYASRPYQQPFWRAMNVEKKLRAIVVWHRRCGKDKTLVNFVAQRMMARAGAYYYIFPTYNQGRKILWEGRDKDGFKFLDHFPEALLRSKPNDTEMKLEFKNGSIFRVIGSDNIDSIVGTNPVGCVFSEYALQDPRAWDYMRPILAENGGWAVFNFTPRGENHGYQLYKMAKDDPSWFCQILTVEDTKIIPPDVLAQERKEIVAMNGNDALYQQEYMCSFKVPIPGSYYAHQMMKAEQDGRVTSVPYEESLPVDTWWDLGISDSMTVWFVQQVGSEIRIIDYYENSGQGLTHYIQKLKEKNYVYGRHCAPHDIKVRELTSGKSRLDTAAGLGINFTTAPNLRVAEGVDAVRMMLGKCWFDGKRCEKGINALKSYHKEFNERLNNYNDSPCHDWASHAADAFRIGAISIDTSASTRARKNYKEDNNDSAGYDFNPETC